MRPCLTRPYREVLGEEGAADAVAHLRGLVELRGPGRLDEAGDRDADAIPWLAPTTPTRPGATGSSARSASIARMASVYTRL
ncbi:hypothetical protein C1J01_15860 [Nonomuraea aridisoli]|uniref:Uncharacterized protein n=1 Tax=Nonomuraea aridisoli TaxID=2070368 RepID=A0A2W2EX80_9ACTN|nr:hypothetical protein C1J01_15860 [Nonomuraea aridisoli]